MPPEAYHDWQSLKAAGQPVGVDRENKVIRGYVVAQLGAFKSKRGEFDLTSLQQIVDHVNKAPAGLKSRFTHPDMSSDGLGKLLGRARGAYLGEATDARTGQTVPAVRADLHLDPTSFSSPSGNLGQYVLDLAASDPEALSSSLVLRPKREKRLNADSTPKVDDKGEPLPDLWRVDRLHASDIVDTGDAVDGLLSAGVEVDGLPLAALWKGAQMLDSTFAGLSRGETEERMLGWMAQYLSRRYGEPGAGIDPADLKRKLRLLEMTAPKE